MRNQWKSVATHLVHVGDSALPGSQKAILASIRREGLERVRGQDWEEQVSVAL